MVFQWKQAKKQGNILNPFLSAADRRVYSIETFHKRGFTYFMSEIYEIIVE